MKLKNPRSTHPDHSPWWSLLPVKLQAGLAKEGAFSRSLAFPIEKKKTQSIGSNIQPPPQGQGQFENGGLPLTSRKMWRAACRGVSPSERETLRGSAPLVRSRKANSKSWCCRHRASGLTGLSGRPSGKAGGDREGPHELHSRDKVQPGHLGAGLLRPLF